MRRELWRAILFGIGALWALSMLPSVVSGMLWVAEQSIEVSADILVVGGSILLVGWAVIPELILGMDDSLDIGRFATSGLSARRLVPGLLVAGVVSVPAAFTGVVALAPLIVWARAGWAPALVTVLAAPAALVTCVLLSRLGTELSARMLSSRRSRETSAALGVLAAGLALPVIITLGSLGLSGALEKVPTLAAVLGWTPLGLVWAAPAAMAAGDLVGAVARLALAFGWVGAGLVAWATLLQRALTRPPSRGGQVRRRADGMLPTGPRRHAHPGLVAAGAIARRGLRYWTADPRYMAALLGAVVAPVLIVLLVTTVVDTPAVVGLSLGAFIGGAIGWGRHNDVAYDGSAFWLHVAAHVPGWADRLGRTVSTVVWAAPLTVLMSLAGAAVAGRWELAGAAVGSGVGVLLAGLAVSAVLSALLPYPVPQAGANPYSAQLGAVGASLVAQLVSSMATLALCTPVLALFAAAVWWDPAFATAALVVGVVGGAGVLAAGVALGGRVYEARAPRLLSRIT
jgi:ABC-2 type transport system permease protein